MENFKFYVYGKNINEEYCKKNISMDDSINIFKNCLKNYNFLYVCLGIQEKHMNESILCFNDGNIIIKEDNVNVDIIKKLKKEFKIK